MFDFPTFAAENSITYKENEPLSAHTSFKVGGRAKYFVMPDTEEKLSQLLCYLNSSKEQFFFLGNGSNVLALDEGFDGVIIKLSGEFENLKTEENGIIAGSAVSLKKLTISAKENSFTGLEFAYGIPGTVGGAVYMNAGAYGGEIKDVVAEVRAMDMNGNVKMFSDSELKLSYRKSVFQENNMIIISARFLLEKGNKEEIAEKMNTLLNKRKEKQPLEYPSAGSTFKRPEGYFAAALIEECSLKGESVGGAEVSEKHSGFIINKGSATAADILALIEKVKAVVLEKKGVKLETEIEILGEVK
ncbi:MAG: UDP-N-acetylmuramate dehydrogenase [Oscillospiraceae bacterium]|nr:UDP-N-acetylmuramate dehydrogenase [Oscillospiraceae bacterium]